MTKSSTNRPRSSASHRKDRRGVLRLEPLERRTLLHGGGLDDDASLYLPPQSNLFDYNGYLSPPSAAAPVAIAENYLRSQASALGILPSDINHYALVTNYVTESTGATTLTFNQTLHGLEVRNATFNVTVAANGQIAYVGGGFVPGLSRLADEPRPEPPLSPTDAVRAAATNLGIALAAEPIVLANDPLHATISAASLSTRPIEAELAYVPTADGDVELSWQFLLRTPDGQHFYDVQLAASTGEFHSLADFADHVLPAPELAIYEAYALPTQNPLERPRSIVQFPQVILPAPAVHPSPYGWHDTNGQDGPEYTITRGNNVNAYADRNADLVPDAGSQPDGGASLDFTGSIVSLDLEANPSTYTSASVANLFYLANSLHDIFYLYGFNEAARNFQVNNYGRGGSGNDPVLAMSQDSAEQGLSNSYFLSTPDGISPEMHMRQYYVNGAPRDSALDTEVVIHEYGHGVTNRLTGDSRGLGALQSAGMGEGWSDFFAIMLTQEQANETTLGRGIGTYVDGQAGDDVGHRQFRYDWDITDPFYETFRSIGNGTEFTTPGNLGRPQLSEVHAVGTRWAAALWDLNHLLIQRYGFEPNIYNSTSNAGNIKALQLVMNGLKIQPMNPSFTQARDAILMADQMLNGGANKHDIWTAFARRGLGQFAQSADSTIAKVTTSFVVPTTVVNRQLFYNGSIFDLGLGVDAADDLAIATDKTPFIPGPGALPSNFNHVSSYTRGINGMMIDLAGTHNAITADDFTFKMGIAGLPDSWGLAPAPTSVTVRSGAGVNGSDRVEIIWANLAIRDTWLQVTVKANARTGLTTPDVFYFGNKLADSGYGNTVSFLTSATDELMARNNAGSKATVVNRFDYNRDGLINGTDQIFTRYTTGTLPFLSLTSNSAVVSRQVFYNNSALDGYNSAADAADDLAMASDKGPYFAGELMYLPVNYATARGDKFKDFGFVHLTNYVRGLNGIAVDFAGAHGAITANDFSFKMGVSPSAANWATAPPPTSITVRPGAGSMGTDRIEIIWPDGAIKNTWLQVTMKANANTGIAAPDVFYFGNQVGDTGLGDQITASFSTTVEDVDKILANFTTAATATNRFDLNRDGLVDQFDALIAAAASGTSIPLLGSALGGPGGGGGTTTGFGTVEDASASGPGIILPPSGGSVSQPNLLRLIQRAVAARPADALRERIWQLLTDAAATPARKKPANPSATAAAFDGSHSWLDELLPDAFEPRV